MYVRRYTVVDHVSYSEVVPEQLHDESTVLVRVLLHLVQFSNSILKCLNNGSTNNFCSCSVDHRK